MWTTLDGLKWPLSLKRIETIFLPKSHSQNTSGAQSERTDGLRSDAFKLWLVSLDEQGISDFSSNRISGHSISDWKVPETIPQNSLMM